MRMEEQSKGRYNKYPDKIDAQLIRILNRYFNDVGRKDLNLVDAIIDEVMQKIKEELGISSTPATADYIASKDVKVNVPTERLKKDISLLMKIIVSPAQNIVRINSMNLYKLLTPAVLVMYSETKFRQVMNTYLKEL